MQDKEKVVDSFLEVLKDKLMHDEDCEQILVQIGQLSKPKYTVCKVFSLGFSSLDLFSIYSCKFIG